MPLFSVTFRIVRLSGPCAMLVLNSPFSPNPAADCFTDATAKAGACANTTPAPVSVIVSKARIFMGPSLLLPLTTTPKFQIHGRYNDFDSPHGFEFPKMTSPDLQRTPLHEVHRNSGAKMVDFGGWDMPVQYSG